MNNNTIQNNGNQFFQENNYYMKADEKVKTKDCVEEVKEVGKLSWAIIAAIIGIVADIITIVIGMQEIKREGLGNMLSTYKLHIYIVVMGVVFAVVVFILRTIFELLFNRTSAKYVLKKKHIYKLVLKKCPICGETCNGKLKVTVSGKEAYCACHRDEMHRWKIEYNDIMNMIQ